MIDITELTNDQKNVMLAEFMGFLKPTIEETEEVLRSRRSVDIRHWTLHRHSGAPIERFSSYYWTPPDFYASEHYNAMVRYKMAEGGNVSQMHDLVFRQFYRIEGSEDRSRLPEIYRAAVCEAYITLASERRGELP